MSEKDVASNEARATAAEVWKPIPGFGGHYEASNHGRVRSFHHRKVTIKKPTVGTDGYPFLILHYDGRRSGHKVGRLICMAFNGLPDDGQECAHLDGNKHNNAPHNLAWASHVENIRHKEIHGTVVHGERHPQCKLTEQVAAEIWLSQGRQCDLARRYGVPDYVVRDIKRRKSWRRLTDRLQQHESAVHAPKQEQSHD